MEKKKLNVTKKEKNIILIALCNYKYECVPSSTRFREIDKILDKYFVESDYLLSD